jgi:phosphopantothenoylcysteine decarboxylase/phosphopantothenate--cysteine ligase
VLHLKKILITAGPTREMLDPVRFLSNLSTGEMGYILARKAVSKGYQVSLVSGPTDLRPPKGVKFYPVVSATQMKKACEELFPKHDGLIMTAAVCDFMPARIDRHKIPSARGLKLKLRRTPDILASLAKRKGRRIVIGFCLETQDLVRRATEKLIKKKLNGIVANFYDPGGSIPFGKHRVEVCLIGADGHVHRLAKRSKAQVSKALLGWMEHLREDPKNLFCKIEKRL